MLTSSMLPSRSMQVRRPPVILPKSDCLRSPLITAFDFLPIRVNKHFDLIECCILGLVKNHEAFMKVSSSHVFKGGKVLLCFFPYNSELLYRLSTCPFLQVWVLGRGLFSQAWSPEGAQDLYQIQPPVG